MHNEERNKMARTEPAGSLGTDSLEEQANYLVDYYQRLCDGEGKDSWLLGLYMSKQWLRYLKEPQHDREELALFVEALESQKLSQGSGWLDLLIRVRNWVARIG